jgi:hypothetical protein
MEGHASTSLLDEGSAYGTKQQCHERALVEACGGGGGGGGDETRVRRLLELPCHTPLADCMGGEALRFACACGNESIVRLLLEWPQHAARADSADGPALRSAASGGFESIVRLLLEVPEHAPSASMCELALRHVDLDASPGVGRLLRDRIRKAPKFTGKTPAAPVSAVESAAAAAAKAEDARLVGVQ